MHNLKFEALNVLNMHKIKGFNCCKYLIYKKAIKNVMTKLIILNYCISTLWMNISNS